MDPSSAAPRPISLTPEDRKLLAKQHFVLVTVQKQLFIGIAVVFGGLWLWASVGALQGESSMGIIWLLSTLALLVAIGGWFWSIPIWEKTATPLTRDLGDGQKICLVGEIIAKEFIGLDPARGMKILLKTPFKADLEEFALPDWSARAVGHDVSKKGSLVDLEYTPHARFVLRLALRIPLTPEVQ